MTHCFHYFYAHRAFMDGLIYCGFGDVFLRLITEYVQQKWSDDPSNIEQAYRLAAFSGMLYNVYSAWVQLDCVQPPEEVAEIFVSFSRPYLFLIGKEPALVINAYPTQLNASQFPINTRTNLPFDQNSTTAWFTKQECLLAMRRIAHFYLQYTPMPVQSDFVQLRWTDSKPVS